MKNINGLLILRQWQDNALFTSGTLFDTINNAIKHNRNSVKEILFFNAEEWEFNWSDIKTDPDQPRFAEDADLNSIREMEKLLIERDIQLHIVYGSRGQIVPKPIPVENTTTHYWPMFWLYGSLLYHSDKESNILNPRLGTNIVPNKIGTCMMNRAHNHRMELMDTFAKDSLLDNALHYTWHNDRVTTEGEYKFKHWEDNNKVYSFPGDKFIGSGNQYSISPPEEIWKGAIHIISESQPDGIFWTEKTFNAINWAVPFVIAGGRHINKMLTTYGFELYDELFDYSFDACSPYSQRINGISVQLKKLNDKYLYSDNFNSFNEIKKLTEEKVIRNRKNYQRILKEHKFIPQILKRLIKQYGKHDNDWEMLDLNFGSIDNAIIKE